MNNSELVSMAMTAMMSAYAPYSDHFVGAALLTADGNVYTGCNIENAAFGPTVCAERVAIFKAVSNGEKDFVKIAVTGGKHGKISDYFYPCGVCRQVMTEFCKQDFEIITAKSADDYQVKTLAEMLPYSFSPDKLEK